MADVFKTASWAIKVPDSWVVDDTEDAVAFTPEADEGAALIVSAFHKNGGTIGMDDMIEAIESSAHEGDAYYEVKVGDYHGCYSSFHRQGDEGESAWRVWCLFRSDLHLYVTFNCAPELRGKHDAQVDDMLCTLMCLREP